MRTINTDALKYLQLRTSTDTEIIPGIICDEIMDDRVQVILVLTGIGATSVDTSQRSVVQEVKREQAAPVSVAAEEDAMLNPFIPSAEPKQMEMAVNQNDLDIPAFLRRKVR